MLIRLLIDNYEFDEQFYFNFNKYPDLYDKVTGNIEIYNPPKEIEIKSPYRLRMIFGYDPVLVADGTAVLVSYLNSRLLLTYTSDVLLYQPPTPLELLVRELNDERKCP